MKLKRIWILIVLVMTITGCSGSPVSQPELTLTPSLMVTQTVVPPTATPAPTATLSTPQVPALVKISLEFYRNGKTYEIVVGYDIGEARLRAPSELAIPDKCHDAQADGATLEWYGDFDQDGEIEYIVSLIYCGTYCYEQVLIYDYDAAIDEYYVADEFSAKSSAVDKYADFDDDGNPELITANFGFCYTCNTATRALTSLVVLRYEDGKFVDVSKYFPGLIKEEADHFLAMARSNNQGAIYITLPAYLYNMYRLGMLEEARPVFDQVCADVLYPGEDAGASCVQFRADVEKAIMEFEVMPQGE